MGELRSSHNLFLLALFNADMPLSSVMLDKRGTKPLCARQQLKRQSILAMVELDSPPVGRPRHDIRSVNGDMYQPAHGPESVLNVSPTAVCLSISQSYFYLASLHFIGGNVDGTLYLLHLSRRYLRTVPKNKEGPSTDEIVLDIRIDALQSVAYLSRGNAARGRALLMRLVEKNHVLAPQDPSCTYMRLIANALFEYSDGLFKDVRVRLRKAINILAMLNDSIVQNLLCLNMAWCSFMSGRHSESKDLLTALLSYAMSTDNSTLLNWGYILDMMIMVFSGDYAAVQVVAERVRHISRKDSYSAGVSAVLGLALILQKKIDRAIPHIRFACRKLSSCSHCFVSTGLLLFVAIMSGLSAVRRWDPGSTRNHAAATLQQEMKDATQSLYRMSQTHGVLKLLCVALKLQASAISLPPLLTLTVVEEAGLADVAFMYSQFVFGAAFYHLFSPQDDNGDNHMEQCSRCFLKLGTSERMLNSCKLVMLDYKRNVSVSEGANSLLVFSQAANDKLPSVHDRSTVHTAEEQGAVVSHYEQEEGAGEEGAEDGTPTRVLVVDDAATALKITTRTLVKEGYEVAQATNGLEAVDCVVGLHASGKPPFDCIIMDLQMPILDGLEATKRIRIFEKTSNLTRQQKIIAISINGDDDTKSDCIEAGFNHFMLKPFNFATFEKLLAS
jgi:CheY-like chemotaxis protein